MQRAQDVRRRASVVRPSFDNHGSSPFARFLLKPFSKLPGQKLAKEGADAHIRLKITLSSDHRALIIAKLRLVERHFHESPEGHRAVLFHFIP